MSQKQTPAKGKQPRAKYAAKDARARPKRITIRLAPPPNRLHVDMTISKGDKTRTFTAGFNVTNDGIMEGVEWAAIRLENAFLWPDKPATINV